MKKTFKILCLFISIFFSVGAYADSLGIGLLPGFGANNVQNDINQVGNDIANSFNPGNVHEDNSNMSGSGAGAGNQNENDLNQRNGSSSSPLFFEPSPGDVSIKFLGGVFGNIGTTLNGDGVPILGQLFSVFNSALMGFALILLSYLIFRGVIDTAAQGEFLGKEFNSVWVPIRVVIGILLLIPRKAGYCIAQIMIMKIIIMGVGVADTLWDTTLNYFQNGGGLTPLSWQAQPDQCVTIPFFGIKHTYCVKQHDIVNPDQTSNQKAVEKAIGNVFTSLVCMQSYATPAKPFVLPIMNPTKDGQDSYTFTSPTGVDCGSVSWTHADGPTPLDASGKPTGKLWYGSTIAMQNIVTDLSTYAGILVNANAEKGGADAKKVYGLIGTDFIKNLSFLYSGTIEDMQTKAPVTSNNGFMNNARNVGWAFAGAYFHDIISTKNQITNNVGIPTTPAMPVPCSSNGDTSLPCSDYHLAGDLITALSDATNATDPFDKNSPTTQNGLSFFPPNDGHHGASMASGQFYTGPASQMYYTPHAGDTVSDFDFNFEGQPYYIPDPNNSYYYDGYVSGLKRHPLPSNVIPMPINKHSGCWHRQLNPFKSDGMAPDQKGSATFTSIPSENELIQSAASMIYQNSACFQLSWNVYSASPGDQIYDMVNKTMTNVVVNSSIQPILALQNVGESLVNTIGEIAVGVMTLNVKKTEFTKSLAKQAGEWSLVPFFGSSLSAIKEASLEAGLSQLTSMQGFLITIGGALLMPAAMMAVYIPLLPYMLFVIGVLGWVLTVFEAMVAAPIVALGIIHPEGHSLYGKARPAVMLLVNVFIKPMLMVMGLIAAILISDQVIAFVNAGFHTVVTATYSSSSILSPNSNINGAAILSLFVLFLYIAIMLALINKCFQLIYIIPDKALRWLDDFVQAGQEEGQVLGEVKSQYSQDVGAAKEVGMKGGETSVAMNNAQNQQVQKTTAAEFALIKTALSPGSGEGGGGGGGGAEDAAAEAGKVMLL